MTTETYMTLNSEQVKDVEARQAIINKWLVDNKTNCITPEQALQLPQVTNAERSAVEYYHFMHDKPEKYCLYINVEKKIATTWTGQELGKVYFGKEYRDNFGGKRVSVDIYGHNGVKYYGTYYKSSGDYAVIKARKNQIKAA